MLDETVAALRLTLPVVTFGAAALVPSAALRALPEALGRRVVRTMLPEGEARSATSVERVLRAPDGWRATLPGPLDVSVDRGWHVVLPAVLPAAPAPPAGEPLRATLVHAASGMTLRRVPAPATDSTPAGPLRAAEPSGGLPPGLDATRLTVRLRAAEELRVRGRRDGDRVRTAGGTRTLGDVLAEAGVPLALRDLLPVVVGADDRTLWVPGVVVDVAAHDGPVEVAD